MTSDTNHFRTGDTGSPLTRAAALQTGTWGVLFFRRASFFAPQTQVKSGYLQTRHKPAGGKWPASVAPILSRRKHAGEKWLPSDAPLFIAPQTRGWKMARFRPASLYCVTNMRGEYGCLQTRLFLSRHKHACGKWLRADGQQS